MQYPLERYEDARGFVLNLFEEMSIPSGNIRNFHVCSLEKGAIRGNHYHENGEEYILFLGSHYRFITEDVLSGEREALFLEDSGRLMKINRKVAHAIRNEGEEPLYLLCFYISKDPLQVKTVRRQIL